MIKTARLVEMGARKNDIRVLRKAPSSKGNGAASATAPNAVAEQFEASLRSWFTQLSERAKRLPGDAQGPECVHELRVCIQRLQALLQMLAPMKDPPWQDKAFRKELAWAMGPLGRARDWDVFLYEVLPAVCGAEPDIAKDISKKRAKRRSDMVHAETREALANPRFQGLIRLFEQKIDEISAALPESSPKSLLKRCRRILNAQDRELRRALAGLADKGASRQHEVRILAKYLRYGSELLSVFYASNQVDRYVMSLAGLQGGLGRLHDLGIGKKLGAEVCMSVRTDSLAAKKTARITKLFVKSAKKDLRASCRRFKRLPPFWAAGRFDGAIGKVPPPGIAHSQA